MGFFFYSFSIVFAENFIKKYPTGNELWIEFETATIDHFTVVDLVPWPLSECEAEVDLVLIQTFFALLWKLSLKNTS